MKVTHRVPDEPRSAELSPEYQAQVDRTMEKAARLHERAESRLAAAERRLARAKRQPRPGKRQQARLIEELTILVEMRRQELLDLHRTMQATGRPSNNIGKRSHQHINVSHPPL